MSTKTWQNNRSNGQDNGLARDFFKTQYVSQPSFAKQQHEITKICAENGNPGSKLCKFILEVNAAHIHFAIFHPLKYVFHVIETYISKYILFSLKHVTQISVMCFSFLNLVKYRKPMEPAVFDKVLNQSDNSISSRETQNGCTSIKFGLCTQRNDIQRVPTEQSIQIVLLVKICSKHQQAQEKLTVHCDTFILLR